jgi:hypothetical protein
LTAPSDEARVIGARVSQRIWLALPFLAVPVLWTCFARGMPVTSDGSIHAMRVVLLDYAVRHGSLYPRWLPQAAGGFGDPALGYYWLTGYYLSELVHLATGLDFVASIGGAITLMVIFGGCGALLFARDLFGRERPWPALVASVA